VSVSIQELEAQETWQDALRGRPFLRHAAATYGTGGRAFRRGVILCDLTDWWVQLPPHRPRPAPDVQLMVCQLRQWTGWTSRVLADALGTTHTTVLAIENGRPLIVSRSGDLRRRITNAHDLVARLIELVDHDAGRVTTVITSPSPSGVSALDQLRAGHSTRAYLTALDVLRATPARGPNDLVIGSRPAQPGGATEPLLG
jgi:hypothetical protein